MGPRELLKASFEAAVAAADPFIIVPGHLPPPPKGRTLVVGAGKAAAAMAAAVEAHWPAGATLDGLVITRYGHGCATDRIRVVEAGHPLPDENGETAAREILHSVQVLGPDDLLLALFSGGGSSLLALPVPEVAMASLKRVTQDLLMSGAPIQEINTVRKHLSQIQGGRLAAACRAPVLALIISDVMGDEPTHIASGPCAPDPTTFGNAAAILERYNIMPPPDITLVLEAGMSGQRTDTPKPSDAIFAKVENRVIACPRQMLSAAGKFFLSQGVEVFSLGDSVSGEAREAAATQAALVRDIRSQGQSCSSPMVLISGGECTVTVRGNGRGGRCAEFLLALALELKGKTGVYALAADTDGIDGSENNAGAYLSPGSLARAQLQGLDAEKLLQNNDAYSFFATLDDLLVTGPTLTNVNDYRVIYLTN